MIRSAAKNFEDVAVVTSPADYDAIAEELQRAKEARSRKQPSGAWRRKRSPPRRPTIRRSRQHWNGISPDRLRSAAARDNVSRKRSASLSRKSLDLRYGENPHQKAAMYSDGSGAGVANAHQVQGKELSYNNIVDLQAAWDLAQEFEEPVCAIIKHTNPCGTATGKTLAEAYKRASGVRSRFGFRRRDWREPARRRSKPPKRCTSCSWRSSPLPPSMKPQKQSSPPRRTCAWWRSNPANQKVGPEECLRRHAGAGCGQPPAGRRRSEGGHQARAHSGRNPRRCCSPGKSAST